MRTSTLAKIVGILAVGIMLGAGFSLLLNLQTVVTPPTPTAPPEYIYVDVYPTSFPTLDVPLPTQCATTGGDYQVVYSGQQTGGYYETLSPDKRARVYSDTQGVYLQHPDGTTQTMYAQQAEYSLPYTVYWSPDSQYLAAAWTSNPPLTVMRADGSDAHTLEGLQFPLNFVSWSPNDHYIALQDNYLGDVSIWTLDGQRTYTSAGRKFQIDQPPVWSPDGKWLLYQWRDNTQVDAAGNGAPYGFTMTAVDGSASADAVLTEANEPNPPFRILPVWSPDNQSVAVTYLQYLGDHYHETVKVFSRAGQQIGETSESIAAEVYAELLLKNNDWNGIHWLENTLVYTRPVAENAFDVLTFSPGNTDFNTLYTDLPKAPFYAPSGTVMAVYESRQRPFKIDLWFQANPRISLVREATDAGDPDWSPDGKWVAVVFAIGEKPLRQVWLKWGRSNSNYQTGIGSYSDVRDIRWIKDNQQLAYIAKRYGDNLRIEIANTETGESRAIAQGYDDIQDFSYDAASDTLSFWWQMADGSAGKDAYRLNGTRIYRITYPSGLPLPRGEFWSPNQKVVAFKVAPANYTGTDEQLWLGYADGRAPLLVRDHLTGLGDPLWSPDSQRLTFTQSRDQRQPSLQVVDTTGADVWDFAPFPVPRPIAWVKCL